MDHFAPGDLWAAVAALLPSEPEKAKVGRPPSSDRATLGGILLMWRIGMPWNDPPGACRKLFPSGVRAARERSTA
jgi:transposase